jgi:hypothetical protein
VWEALLSEELVCSLYHSNGRDLSIEQDKARVWVNMIDGELGVE